MNYEEKILLLNENDWFTLFSRLNVEPRWVTSAGKRAIQIIGACHAGENHSALFDPDTLIVNCFSECGRGMLLHTWIKQALRYDNSQEAKDFIEDWIENQDIDLSDRIPRGDRDFDFKERPFEVKHIEPVKAIEPDIINELYSRFDTRDTTLERLLWHKEDKIDVSILKMFDVAFYEPRGSIILPHHNINGGIVGLYERSFKPLRKKIKSEYPDIDYKKLLEYPRAKYVPLLRDEKWQDEEKTSWSFPNSENLYGFHLAAEAIRKHKKAIIFEGGKSVMLAHQYGYPYAVATHTFGAHLNHIAMLIEAGAEEIILAFDKQYEDMDGQPWELYERKTYDLAQKVKAFVQVSRMIDIENKIGYKDSPIDKGVEIFQYLFQHRQNLTEEKPVGTTKEMKPVVERMGKNQIALKISDTRYEENQYNLSLDDEFIDDYIM